MDSRRKPVRTSLRNRYETPVRVIRRVPVEGEPASTISESGLNGMRAIERAREAGESGNDDES